MISEMLPKRMRVALELERFGVHERNSLCDVLETFIYPFVVTIE